MITIPSYDLQQVPADYDKPELPSFNSETEDSVKIIHYPNGAKFSLPLDVPDEIMMDIMLDCWAYAQHRLNEFREQQAKEFCGF